ncbi:MAG: hypothetical protein WDZ82_02330 [Candidatus Paceibacterota bacterium]
MTSPEKPEGRPVNINREKKLAIQHESGRKRIPDGFQEQLWNVEEATVESIHAAIDKAADFNDDEKEKWNEFIDEQVEKNISDLDKDIELEEMNPQPGSLYPLLRTAIENKRQQLKEKLAQEKENEGGENKEKHGGIHAWTRAVPFHESPDAKEARELVRPVRRHNLQKPPKSEGRERSLGNETNQNTGPEPEEEKTDDLLEKQEFTKIPDGETVPAGEHWIVENLEDVHVTVEAGALLTVLYNARRSTIYVKRRSQVRLPDGEHEDVVIDTTPPSKKGGPRGVQEKPWMKDGPFYEFDRMKYPSPQKIKDTIYEVGPIAREYVTTIETDPEDVQVSPDVIWSAVREDLGNEVVRRTPPLGALRQKVQEVIDKNKAQTVADLEVETGDVEGGTGHQESTQPDTDEAAEIKLDQPSSGGRGKIVWPNRFSEQGQMMRWDEWEQRGDKETSEKGEKVQEKKGPTEQSAEGERKGYGPEAFENMVNPTREDVIDAVLRIDADQFPHSLNKRRVFSSVYAALSRRDENRLTKDVPAEIQKCVKNVIALEKQMREKIERGAEEKAEPDKDKEKELPREPQKKTDYNALFEEDNMMGREAGGLKESSKEGAPDGESGVEGTPGNGESRAESVPVSLEQMFDELGEQVGISPEQLEKGKEYLRALAESNPERAQKLEGITQRYTESIATVARKEMQVKELLKRHKLLDDAQKPMEFLSGVGFMLPVFALFSKKYKAQQEAQRTVHDVLGIGAWRRKDVREIRAEMRLVQLELQDRGEWPTRSDRIEGSEREALHEKFQNLRRKAADMVTGARQVHDTAGESFAEAYHTLSQSEASEMSDKEKEALKAQARDIAAKNELTSEEKKFLKEYYEKLFLPLVKEDVRNTVLNTPVHPFFGNGLSARLRRVTDRAEGKDAATVRRYRDEVVVALREMLEDEKLAEDECRDCKIDIINEHIARIDKQNKHE